MRRSPHRSVRPALNALLVATALVATMLAPATFSPAVAAPPGAPVRYVHDALGRLVTVMDPTGQVARYNYDAAGNVLSIARSTAAALSVVDLSPRTANKGGRLSIIGRGFSSTPADNVVRLNGVVAPVVSATPTELVVTVPATATSGPVTVTTPGGVATRSQPHRAGEPQTGRHLRVARRRRPG